MNTKGSEIIDSIIRKLDKGEGVSFIDFLHEIELHIADFQKTQFVPNALSECDLRYGPLSLEYLIWGLGLMCLEYSQMIFTLKRDEGHCRGHSRPCSKGAWFHDEILKMVSDSFKERLKGSI